LHNRYTKVGVFVLLKGTNIVSPLSFSPPFPSFDEFPLHAYTRGQILDACLFFSSSNTRDGELG
jgi:hypothetical protein